MRVKKVVEKSDFTAPNIKMEAGLVYPDLLVGGRMRPWGYIKHNMPNTAFLFHQKVKTEELQAIGEWCLACAKYLTETTLK